LLDSFFNTFVINLRYKIGQEELKEVIAQVNITDHKVVLGNNIMMFQNNNDRITVSFDYCGYFKNEEVHRLQNLKFTLFVRKPKLQRPPTNRAFSMGTNTSSDNMLLTTTTNAQKSALSKFALEKSASTLTKPSSSKLKISSSSYHASPNQSGIPKKKTQS